MRYNKIIDLLEHGKPVFSTSTVPQLLVGCNGNLAVIDCRRRLAPQRDSVIA
jgi:hypothetical protein